MYHLPPHQQPHLLGGINGPNGSTQYPHLTQLGINGSNPNPTQQYQGKMYLSNNMDVNSNMSNSNHFNGVIDMPPHQSQQHQQQLQSNHQMQNTRQSPSLWMPQSGPVDETQRVPGLLSNLTSTDNTNAQSTLPYFNGTEGSNLDIKSEKGLDGAKKPKKPRPVKKKDDIGGPTGTGVGGVGLEPGEVGGKKKYVRPLKTTDGTLGSEGALDGLYSGETEAGKRKRESAAGRGRGGKMGGRVSQGGKKIKPDGQPEGADGAVYEDISEQLERPSMEGMQIVDKNLSTVEVSLDFIGEEEKAAKLGMRASLKNFRQGEEGAFSKYTENAVLSNENSIVAGVEFSYPTNVVDSSILEPLRLVHAQADMTIGIDVLEFLSYSLQQHVTTILEACIKNSKKRRNTAANNVYNQLYEKNVIKGETDPNDLDMIWGPHVNYFLESEEKEAKEELKRKELEEEESFVREMKGYDEGKKAQAVVGGKRRGPQTDAVDNPWWIKEVH
jgi:hypothetical protein